MRKKIISLLLAVVMVLPLVPVFELPVSAANFAGGAGTQTNPYLIETKAHLNNVRNNLSAHYKMIADIVFTKDDFAEGGTFYNNGTGWQTIGDTYPSAFTGTFDGNGHTIVNLTLLQQTTKSTSAGLFKTNKGIICNLGMENCNIYISNDGDVYSYVGGIAGSNYGTISNCYTTGFIGAEGALGSSYVGGITGWHYSGNIKECYNMASVIATYSAGGITGYADNRIENCFNTGLITAKKNEDGSSRYTFAGGITGLSSDTITCCYNIGSIVSSSNVGGIYAQGDPSTNCYYYNHFTKGTSSYYSGNCTLAGLKLDTKKLEGFDFEKIWTIGGNSDYPFPELVFTPTVYKKVIKSILIETAPSKLTYIQGYELLDVTGGTLKIVYEYDEHDIIPLSEAALAGFDNSIVGKQNISASYAGYTTEFEVVVTAKGDVDGVDGVDLNDAIYLLYHVNFADTYPVNQTCDFDGNGEVDLNDAIYLLYHVNFPSSYPLH